MKKLLQKGFYKAILTAYDVEEIKLGKGSTFKVIKFKISTLNDDGSVSNVNGSMSYDIFTNYLTANNMSLSPQLLGKKFISFVDNRHFYSQEDEKDIIYNKASRLFLIDKDEKIIKYI